MVKIIMLVLISLCLVAGYVFLSPIAFRFSLMGAIVLAGMVYSVYYYWTDLNLDSLAQEVERERNKINQ